MRWTVVIALTLALSAAAKAAPDALDCPGRPWPQIGTVKVERTVANGEPRVSKIAHFEAANAIAPNERYVVLQSVSGRPGQRMTASSYATMGRLSCLYDYRYTWIGRRGKPFRVMGHFLHAARTTPDGKGFGWPVNCFLDAKHCQLQPHTGRMWGDEAFLLIILNSKHPDGEVCVRGAPPGKATVELFADGQVVARVGRASGTFAAEKYVCLDAASPATLAAIKNARRIAYESGAIETTGLSEALAFARQLRERVALAEGGHERELRLRANADARLAAVE
jgi:hypothetical protein